MDTSSARVPLPSTSRRSALIALLLWGVAGAAAYGAFGEIPVWWAPVAWWVSLPFLVLWLAFLAVSQRVVRADEDGLDVHWAPWGVGGFRVRRDEILGITLTPLGAPEREVVSAWSMEVHTRRGPRPLGARFPSASTARAAATDLREALGLLDSSD